MISGSKLMCVVIGSMISGFWPLESTDDLCCNLQDDLCVLAYGKEGDLGCNLLQPEPIASSHAWDGSLLHAFAQAMDPSLQNTDDRNHLFGRSSAHWPREIHDFGCMGWLRLTCICASTDAMPCHGSQRVKDR